MIENTIFALCTPIGRSGVAVIRVSGSAAKVSLSALSGGSDSLEPRKAHVRTLRRPDDSRETIDHALVLYFQGPASFTGEDVVEYHVHGGPAVIQSLLDSLGQCEGHRLAEPGEFTRRAFENGKMDLTQAEAIADLIDAETQAQKIQALGQMDGALSKLYHDWAERLTKTLAHLEADIEFPDEDLPDEISPEVKQTIRTLTQELAEHLDDNHRGERLRDGLHVAVIGAPNAGKSSLVNALAKRDVAIVSDMEGTTRDVIEVHLDLGGFPIILSDTAGLRPDQIGSEGHDKIESEGIRRALEKAENADIKLLIFDAGDDTPDTHTLALKDENSIVVLNKTDGPQNLSLEDSISVSAIENQGLEVITDAILMKAKTILGQLETPSLTRKRHRKAIEEAHISLERSASAALPELMAEDVRLAVRALGSITGKVDVEDLLDVVFADFCIGK